MHSNLKKTHTEYLYSIDFLALWAWLTELENKP